MAPEDKSLELPWARVGPYRLLCELGRGSMAVVYLGRTEGPGGFERLCALKMIHPHLSEAQEFVDLFLNEARIAAMIHHPNVIAVDDIGLHDGRYYLRMNYVSGETLFQALNRTWNEGTPFPLPIAAQIIAEVTEGLHAAHELKDPTGAPLGVIHRDLGPHNILIGYDGVVRVMDFGIAKALDQVTATQPGTWRGTAAFMSPEQVRGEPIDRRADVFSLGVVLWETTVGARLFKHTTMAGTMTRILSLDVPRPSSLRADYAPELERIVLKALERDPARRYSTARELGEDLSRYLVEIGVAQGAASLERFMAETFRERHEERALMEQEARRHDYTGRMQTVLKAPPKTELPPAFGDAPEPTIQHALGQSAALPSVDPSEAPTGVAPRPRTEPGIRRPKSRAIPWESIGLGAAVIALLVSVGIAFKVALREKPTQTTVPLAMVRLSFVLAPPEAKLTIDGAAQEGDLVVPLSPQQYQVQVAAEGYLPKTLVVSAEASRAIEVSLDPLPNKGKAQRPRLRHRGSGRR